MNWVPGKTVLLYSCVWTISFYSHDCQLYWEGPVTIEQGVPGDAVPWPGRGVSPQHPLLFPGLPQAAQERYLNSYKVREYRRDRRSVKGARKSINLEIDIQWPGNSLI